MDEFSWAMFILRPAVLFAFTRVNHYSIGAGLTFETLEPSMAREDEAIGTSQLFTS